MKLLRYFALVVVMTLGLFALCVCSTCATGTDLPAELSGFEVVAENEYLRLYFYEKTNEIAVMDLQTGCVFFSNPPLRNSEERIARGQAKERQNSQFSIAYYTPSDTLQSMNNYSDSVVFGQYDVLRLPDGIRVDYTLGQEWKDEDFLPVMISQDRFEQEILANIGSESDRNFVRNSYRLLSLRERSESEEPPAVYGVDVKALLGDCELVSLDNSRTSEKDLITFLVDQVVAHRKDLSGRSEVRGGDVAQLREIPTYVLRNDLFSWDLEDLAAIVKETGYRPEDAQIDHEANHIDCPQPNPRVFRVPIEYILDGRDLVVRIPAGEVEYPIEVLDRDGSRATYPIHSIRLMEYFGAAGPASEGYIFVPDGSGALIYLNNGKLHASPYKMPVYGNDRSVELQTERLRHTSQAYLPVYGLKQSDKAFMAIIDDGQALATITADIAGRNSSYNTVSADFVLLPKGTASLRTGVAFVMAEQVYRNSINVYQDRQYMGLYQVRYVFLSGDEADYVGMAKRYQQHLIGMGELSRVDPSEETPLFLELVGAIDDVKPILGIPRTVVEPLTTYEEAARIVADLTGRGIAGLKVVYTGWMKGGLAHIPPSRVAFESVLGGSKGFNQLLATVREKGIDFYPEVQFLSVRDSGLLDGFFPRRDASVFVNGRVGKLYDYNEATKQLTYTDPYYILSPRVLPRFVEGFLRDYESLGLGAVALSDVGRNVDSDFRKGADLVDREQSVDVIRRELARISDIAGAIAVKGANSYVFPYVDSIVGVPMEDSRFRLVDEPVPFLQIVLHGFINYAGDPINLSEDPATSLLKSIEVGAYPYFRLFYRDPSIVKDTDYGYLYSCCYFDWVESVVTMHGISDGVFNGLQDQRIVDHEKLKTGVYKTTYESGTSIVVNYNNEPVTLDDIEVPGRSFWLIQEAEKSEG